jgi:predicted nucleic acid-binding protein
VADVVVDSNVLLDVLLPVSAWSEWSEGAIAAAGDQGRLIINAVIFAEVSAGYAKIEDLEAALPRQVFLREPISDEAAFLAGKAFVAYRRRGGERRSPLPDFLIGAHAAVAGYKLLTRDRARYRTYFPTVALIAPD